MTTVGVLGTGTMGGAMSRAIARSGVTLLLYNRTFERAAALASELSARPCRTAAEVAAEADVLISMVSDDRATDELYRGADGILAGLRRGAIAVSTSTILPETVRGLEPAVRERGAGLLDAPVSGSTSLAEAGKLTVMAGGTAADLERARPVLETIAARVFHVGRLGAGAAMKLAVNTIIFGLNEALAEGLVLAERAGIEPAVAYEVFAVSAAGAPYVGYKRAAFLEPASTPPAFSIALAEKDLRLILTEADRVGLDLPQTRQNLEALRAAEASRGGEADFSAVAVHLRGEGGPMP